MFLEYPLVTKNGDIAIVPETVDGTLYRVWYLIDGQRESLLFAEPGVIITYLQGLIDTLTPENVDPYVMEATQQGALLQIEIYQNNTKVLNFTI